MRTGAVLPNQHRALTEDELSSLKAIMTPSGLIVRAWDYTPLKAIRQVLTIDPTAWIVLRSRFNGQIDVTAWISALLPAAHAIATTTARLILGPVNEPNHPSSPYARDDQGTRKFAEDYERLTSELRRTFPAVPTVSPNLAVHHHDLEWARELNDTFAHDDFTGVNAYWQYDNHLNPDWGLRGLQVAAELQRHPNKPTLTLETGDSTPDRSPLERARRIHENLDAQAAAGVAGASVFILGGTKDWADTFHYPTDAWAAMRPSATTDAHDDHHDEPDDDPGPWASIGNWRVHDLRATIYRDSAHDYARRAPQAITEVIIHHSATPSTTTPDAIARWHVDHNQWPGIAYHFLVHDDGRVDYVGDLSTTRYHAGDNNARSVGICLVGNFTDAAPPQAQLEATRRLVAEVQYQLGDFLPVIPHRQVMQTACPGDTWPTWADQVQVLPPAQPEQKENTR